MTLRSLLALLLLAPALAADEPKALPRVIAHRGSSVDRPECTLAAVRRAIEIGAAMVEVDVRRTKDGRLVILHDETLDRTTSGKGRLADRTLAEVRTLDAGAWFDAKFAGEKVPAFAEVLAACKGRIDLLVDLKEQGADYAEVVVAEVKAHGDPKRTWFGVRSVEQAKQFGRLLPDSRRLGLTAKPDDFEAFIGAGVDTIRVWERWLSDETLVPRIRRAGAKLLINPAGGEPRDILPLLKHRPEWLSADDPAKMLKILADRK